MIEVELKRLGKFVVLGHNLTFDHVVLDMREIDTWEEALCDDYSVQFIDAVVSHFTDFSSGQQDGNWGDNETQWQAAADSGKYTLEKLAKAEGYTPSSRLDASQCNT